MGASEIYVILRYAHNFYGSKLSQNVDIAQKKIEIQPIYILLCIYLTLYHTGISQVLPSRQVIDVRSYDVQWVSNRARYADIFHGVVEGMLMLTQQNYTAVSQGETRTPTWFPLVLIVIAVCLSIRSCFQ